MFHAPRRWHPGNPDQLTDGGGPSLLPAENRGPEYAERTARGPALPSGERRMGHLSTLQRSSRASDGTPMHLRVDGPGFDPMDVPDGSSRAGGRSCTSASSCRPRTSYPPGCGAARPRWTWWAKYIGVAEQDNGLERFLTCTRRQNFLVPPRRHRAFPLTELA